MLARFMSRRPILARRAFCAAPSLSTFAAERMGNLSLAASDPVEDYRVIANGTFWKDVIGERTQLNCLDVCSGTGRWMQTFAEMVARPRDMSVTFDCVDLCKDSLSLLQTRFPELPDVADGATHFMDAGALEGLEKTFDLATNMHGLYAMPADILENVVSSMIGRVRPGGACIIALGDLESFYLRYSFELVECGVMSERYTAAEDVIKVLENKNVEYECIKMDYVEKTTNDQELRHFLENESGGNTWPASDDRTGKALSSLVAPNVKKLLDQFVVSPGTHHFPQSVSVVIVRP